MSAISRHRIYSFVRLATVVASALLLVYGCLFTVLV